MFGTAAKFYQKQVYKQLHKLYRPTWLPDVATELGGVGVLKNGVYQPLASGEDVGLTFDINPDDSPTQLDVTYSKGVKLTFKVEGETKANLPNIPKAKAGFGVEFSRAGAFIVQASESFEPRISNIIDLQRQVIDLFAQGKWNKDWVVVTAHVFCPAATILISKAKGTKLEFSVSGDVPAGGVELGKAGITFKPEVTSNAAISLVNARDVTPFLKLVGLNMLAFGPSASPFAMATTAAGSANGPPPLSELEMVTPAMVQDDDELRGRLVLAAPVDPIDDLLDDLLGDLPEDQNGGE